MRDDLEFGLTQVQGCLVGLQLGDRLGMPWEMMKPEEILADTDGRGVTGFAEPRNERRLKSLRPLKLGDATDDWQRARALTRTFIRCRGYNQTEFARELANEYALTTAGWGSMSRFAVGQLHEWFESSGTRGRDPKIPAVPRKPNDGGGNGVAMGIAPMALGWELFPIVPCPRNSGDLFHHLWSHGKLTHPDPHASIAAFAIMTVIRRLLWGRRITIENWRLRQVSVLHLVINESVMAEGVVKAVDKVEQFDDSVGLRLITIAEEGLLQDPLKLRERIGTSSWCLQSVPFAIATFMRHLLDYRAGVLEAINAGGDTDTNAAMVGAMIGANVGLEGIPKEWLEFRPEIVQEALDLGKQLWQAAHS